MADLNAIFRSGKIIAGPPVDLFTGGLTDVIAALAERIAVLDSTSVLNDPFTQTIIYTDDAGIDTGASSNYNIANGVVSNQSQSEDTFSLTDGSINYTNRCGINRFSGLSASGSSVRVLFQASAAGTRDIDAAYIGTHPGSGNAWDADTDNTQLLFGGSGTTSLTAGEEKWSDWVSFDLVHTDDIVIAVDEGATGNSDYENGYADVNYYHKTATDNAADQSRESGYTTNSGRCKGIAAIEVMGDAQNITLISIGKTANTGAPDKGAINLVYNEPNNDVVSNTDLVAEMSRDGKTNWSTITLSDLYTVGSRTVASGSVDLSGQPSGTEIHTRITTPGGTPKVVEIVRQFIHFE